MEKMMQNDDILILIFFSNHQIFYDKFQYVAKNIERFF